MRFDRATSDGLATPEVAVQDMVDVPAGEFWMGCDTGLPDQRPVHRVRVAAFRMARFALTRAEYAAYCSITGVTPPDCWGSPLFSQPRQPAVGIDWFAATAYAEWLARATGRKFRLPTEAERERSARGLEEGQLYPWGDTASPDGRSIGVLRAPTPVEASLPNSLGIHGLADGVHEWCLDWYSPGYYALSEPEDPKGPSSGTRRVSRGGSWRHAISTTPCAARSSLPPGKSYTDYGFRLVETAV